MYFSRFGVRNRVPTQSHPQNYYCCLFEIIFTISRNMIFTLISIVANLIIILACLISDIGLQFHQQWLSLSFENTLFFWIMVGEWRQFKQWKSIHLLVVSPHLLHLFSPKEYIDIWSRSSCIWNEAVASDKIVILVCHSQSIFRST